MAKRLIHMNGDELVEKILVGERKFPRIKLEEGADLSVHEGYISALEQLREQAKSGDYQPFDFSWSDLRGIRAPGFFGLRSNFYRAILQGADLSEANLRRANLREANLRGSNLEKANLKEANLKKAELIEANLRGARLYGSKLNGAHLTEADLTEADLNGAHLTEAYLRGAHLNRASFVGAFLTAANLRGASLNGTEFYRAVLAETNLTNVVDLESACNLHHALLVNITTDEKNQAIIEAAHQKARKYLFR